MTLSSHEMIILGCAAVFCLIVVVFFRPRLRTARRLPSPPEIQEVFVRVDEHFHPETIVLLRSVPAKLRFQRETDEASSEVLVFPSWAVERTLPAFKTTTIDLTPDDPGVFAFQTKDERIKGVIVVQE